MRLLLSCIALLALAVTRADAVTLQDLEYTEENCIALRADNSALGFVPCDCRLNTGNVQAVPCYPNCCPKTSRFEGDRCHSENREEWSVYEQHVCFESPSAEYTDQTPNCFYRGNIPYIRSVGLDGGNTQINFELSILPEHICDDLYIASCNPKRVIWDDFRVNTTDPIPKYCWLNCSPKVVSPCTSTSCWANRGRTEAVVHSWTLDRRLPPGDYALVCYTMVRGASVGSELWQSAYASIGFKAV